MLLAVVACVLSTSLSLAAATPAGSGELRSALTALVDAAYPDVDRHQAAARVEQVLAKLDGEQQAIVADALGQLASLEALPKVITASRASYRGPAASAVVGADVDLEDFRSQFLSLLGRFYELSTMLDDPAWGDRLIEIEDLVHSLPPEALPLLYDRYVEAAPVWREAFLHPEGAASSAAKAQFAACREDCDGDGNDSDSCGVDPFCWGCRLDEAFCDLGQYATQISNFVSDFFDDVADVFTDIAALPAQIGDFFVGLVTSVEEALTSLVDDLVAAFPSSPQEALALLGLDDASWASNVLASVPLIDLPCPAIGTEVPGIGTMGSIQAEYTCKRGIDWVAAMLYDVVPDDIYDIPAKAIATAVYYPINYFCLCVEAQSNIAFFGDQAAHRDLVEAKLDAVMGTRSSQNSVNTLNASLIDLDGDVAVVEAKLDVLEVKLDGLQVSQNGNSDALDLFRELVVRLNIEEHLLEHPDDVILLFQRPAAMGGYLETVRDIVAETIQMNTAAGQRVYGALAELNDGDIRFADGDWAGAFDSYRRAYEQAVK